MIFSSKLKPKNSRLFYRWLLSYISILLIPLFISVTLSMLSMQVMINETNRANMAMLKQVQDNIDEKISAFKEGAYQICLDNNLKFLLNVNGEFEDTDQFTLFKLVRQLNIYITTNKYMSNIFLYLKNTDSIISNENKTDSSYFYDLYFSNSSMPYEGTLELLNGEHNMDYKVLEKNLPNGKKTRVVAFLQSLPLVRSASPTGILMGLIPEEKFMEILKSLRWMEQYELLIVDRDGNILISDGPENLPADAVKSLVTDENERLTYSYQGKKFIVTRISSEASDWNYVLTIPYEVFWEKSVYISKITVFGVLVCIFAGGIVAYLFTRKNYDPIGKIVRTLEPEKAVMKWEKENEYNLISNAINKNIREIKIAYKEIERQKIELKNKFLRELLEGKPDKELSPEKAMTLYNINVEGTQFAVLLFCIEDYYVFKADQEDDNISAFRLAQFALKNVLKELTEDVGKGNVVELEGMVACIMNFSGSDTERNKNELEDIAKSCQVCLQDQLHLYFTASISNMHPYLEDLPEAYGEVLDAMEYRKLMGSGGIIKYECLENRRYSYNYSMQTEQKLINCIKAGDLSQSREIVNDIIRINLCDTSFSGEMAKCLMVDLTSTIVKAMYEICDIGFLESIKPMKRLLAGSTVLEMKEQILLVLELVCRHIRENTREDNQLSKDVIEYINANYNDVNLSLMAISDKFDFTRPYLSMLFKSQTGQTILDYINKVRIGRAKQLLKEGRFSISDTAARVGYSNSSVFIRNFKKYEGVTPGEYKEI